MNIGKILKDKPIGTELYATTRNLGKVELRYADDDMIVVMKRRRGKLSFNTFFANGNLYSPTSGECQLWPAKGQKWENYE